MIRNEDIICDLHTHTVFSKHAYSTIAENIIHSPQHIKYIAVTDHFYCQKDRIENKNEIVRILYTSEVNKLPPLVPEHPVYLLNGGEFNINHKLDSHVIDVSKVYKKVKWRLVGNHSWFFDSTKSTLDELYDSFKDSLFPEEAHLPDDKLYIKPTAFAHIERELWKLTDYNVDKAKDCMAALVDLAIANNIYLEINEHSIIVDEKDGVARMNFWIEYANSKNAMFCLGTDAHYCMQVGRFDRSVEMLNKFNVPAERVLNHKINEPLVRGLL